MSHSIRSLSLLAALSITPLLSFAQTDGQTVVMEFNCANRFVLSSFEQRIVDRQEQGTADLRRYLYITRGIHTMNFEEATLLADRVHARQRACARFAIDAPLVEAAK